MSNPQQSDLMASSSRNDSVERLVARFCEPLAGCVTLSSADTASSSLSAAVEPPPPRIVVRFDCAPSSDAADSASLLQLAHRRLEAVSVLSSVATCRAFSWRRNPLFWLRVLQTHCQVLNCDEFFEQRLLKCIAPDATTDYRWPRSTRVTSSKAMEDRIKVAAWHERMLENDERRHISREGETPTFVLDFSFTNVTPEMLGLCRRFLTAKCKGKAKSWWRISYSKAMATLGDLTRVNRHRAVPVKIGLCFNRCRFDGPASLVALRDLLNDVQERCATCRAMSLEVARRAATTEWWWLVFDVTHLDLSSTKLGKKELARLANIVALLRSSIRELVLDQVFIQETLTDQVAVFGNLMTESFRLTPAEVSTATQDGTQPSRNDASLYHRRSIERLSMSFNAFTEFQISSLFSAIHSGKTVGTLTLEGAFLRFHGDPVVPWLWLAYGVFHAESKSSISHLNLSGNVVRMQDIQAIQHFLDPNTPYAELLLQGSERQQKQSTFYSNQAQRVILSGNSSLRQTREPNASAPLRITRDCSCKVLSHGKKWSCVLIPGYGKLWAKSSRLTHLNSSAVHPSRMPTALTSLAMNSMQTDQDDTPIGGVLRQLIQTIGRPIQTLQLHGNPLSELDLASVLESCPNLLHLDVEDCEVPGISPIIERYSNGTCRLQTLNLAENDIPTHDIVELCRLLHDPSRGSAAMSLKELHLELNPIERTGLQNLRYVFSVNRTLQLLTLGKGQDSDGQLQYRFAVFHDEELGVQPLTASHRAALLSVGAVYPNVQRCDIPVLTLIVEFAAERIRRQIVWK